MKRPARPRRPIGVSAQMALGFGIFALVTVVLLWVFQIFLLNPFYQAIKTQEAEQTAEAIVRQLDSDQLDAAARALCIKSGSNIFVSDSRGRQPVGYKHIFQDSLTAGLSQMERAALFDQVNLHGGEYTQFFRSRQTGGTELLFYAVTVRTPSGLDWMVAVETEITPMSATVETLLAQLICLTLVLLPLGILLAVYIPRRLTRPLTKMN